MPKISVWLDLNESQIYVVALTAAAFSRSFAALHDSATARITVSHIWRALARISKNTNQRTW